MITCNSHSRVTSPAARDAKLARSPALNSRWSANAKPTTATIVFESLRRGMATAAWASTALAPGRTAPEESSFKLQVKTGSSHECLAGHAFPRRHPLDDLPNFLRQIYRCREPQAVPFDQMYGAGDGANVAQVLLQPLIAPGLKQIIPRDTLMRSLH